MHDQEATEVRNKRDALSPPQNLANCADSARSAASRSQQSQLKAKKVQKVKRVNQFKANKMTHEEIINFLFDLSSSSVTLNRKLEPRDLDSTQGLDPFL